MIGYNKVFIGNSEIGRIIRYRLHFTLILLTSLYFHSTLLSLYFTLLSLYFTLLNLTLLNSTYRFFIYFLLSTENRKLGLLYNA